MSLWTELAELRQGKAVSSYIAHEYGAEATSGVMEVLAEAVANKHWDAISHSAMTFENIGKGAIQALPLLQSILDDPDALKSPVYEWYGTLGFLQSMRLTREQLSEVERERDGCGCARICVEKAYRKLAGTPYRRGYEAVSSPLPQVLDSPTCWSCGEAYQRGISACPACGINLEF